MDSPVVCMSPRLIPRPSSRSSTRFITPLASLSAVSRSVRSSPTARSKESWSGTVVASPVPDMVNTRRGASVPVAAGAAAWAGPPPPPAPPSRYAVTSPSRITAVSRIARTLNVTVFSPMPHASRSLGPAVGRRGRPAGSRGAVTAVRRGRSAGLGAGDPLERDPVALDALARHHRDGVRGDDRRVPELLGPLEGVGDVHLHQGRLELRAGVVDGVGVVRPRGGIEHDRHRVVGGGVEPVHHHALVVGLPHLHLEPELAAPALAELGQLGVGGGAVDLRLPAAEPAEVGSVEDEDLHASSFLSVPARTS